MWTENLKKNKNPDNHHYTDKVTTGGPVTEIFAGSRKINRLVKILKTRQN